MRYEGGEAHREEEGIEGRGTYGSTTSFNSFGRGLISMRTRTWKLSSDIHEPPPQESLYSVPRDRIPFSNRSDKREREPGS